jgi:hypothetical protein
MILGRKQATRNVEDSNIEFSYILGNPPFAGSRRQLERQKEDTEIIFHSVSSVGVLDYVAVGIKKPNN